MMTNRLLVLTVALLLDLLIGDPPNKYHPVAWMGSMIASLQKHTLKENKPVVQFFYGGFIIIFGVLLVGGLGLGIEQLLQGLASPYKWLIGGLVLKTMFSLHDLVKAANQVQAALEDEDLPEARRLVSWHLVSRDTSLLNKPQITAAAIESVAENTSDSVIAPLFYYLFLGLPGALVYRFANTADAMLGYRDAKREWLGKIPARFDDLLNLVPARLTAFLFIGVSCFSGVSVKNAAAIWARDRYKTASPNAGHPMSAAAGALGVELEKVSHYRLGAGSRFPQPDDLRRMVQLMQWTVALVFGLIIVVSAFSMRI